MEKIEEKYTFFVRDIANMAPLIVILIAAWAWDWLSGRIPCVTHHMLHNYVGDVIVIITGAEGGMVSGHVSASDDQEEEERDQEHGMKFLLCSLP